MRLSARTRTRRPARARWSFGLFVPAVALALAQPAPAAPGSPAAPAKVAEAKGGKQTEDGKTPRRPERWYTATIANDESGGFLMVHFWSKGSLFRSEAVIAGRPIVTIVDAKTYYIFERVSAQGVAIERSARAMEQDADRGRPFARELDELIRAGGELIGTEDSPAGPLDVYRVTNDSGRRTVWMSTKRPQVPLRVVTFDRATSTTGKVDYVNWVYGPEIPDSYFAPDSRIVFEKISYEEYRKRLGREAVGPAPVLYRDLLHGHE